MPVAKDLAAVNTSCAVKEQGEQGAKPPNVNVDQNGVILKGYDPVAYFKQKQAVKGDPKYASS